MRQKIPKNIKGVAILTVMVGLALMMAIVTELSTRELLKYKLAINERDAFMAEALAQSGANFAQIILMVQEPLQTYLSNFAKMGVQLPAYTVWELMPIDSDLLKGITDGSFLPDFGLGGNKKEQHSPPEDPKKEKISIAETKSKNVPLFGPYEAPEGGYGAFMGRFSVEIEDEEKKISIRKWTNHQPEKQKMIADQIIHVLAKPENSILFDKTLGNTTNIGPQQLVANMYDYISSDERAVDITASKERFGRDMLGDKRVFYNDMPGIVPKKAPLDSMGELRLVPGMTDAIYQTLSKIITIYGESEKINLLSTSDEVIESLFILCAKSGEPGPIQQPSFVTELVNEWNRKKNEGTLQLSPEGLISHLEQAGVVVDKDVCLKSVGTESKTFSVKSTATVGTVTKTLLMRLRSVSGLITQYQFQYL